MDAIGIVEKVADTLTAQYQMFLVCVGGAYSQAIEKQDPTTPVVRAELEYRMHRYSAYYLEDMMSQLDQHTKNLSELTLTGLGAVLSDPDKQTLSGHLSECMDELRANLNACMSRDCRTVLADLRKFSLRVSLAQSSTGVSKSGAIVRERITSAKPTFAQQDKLGRKRGSEGFVRSVVRQYILLAHIETSLFAFAKAGDDLAMWVREDGTLGNPFSITGGTSGYRAYEDIRDDVFHPNSTSSVVVFKE